MLSWMQLEEILRSTPDALFSLAAPFLWMSFALSYLPGTVVRLIRYRDFGTLFSWPRFQTVWFGDFWAWAGPQLRKTEERYVLPLLAGRVHNGREVDAAAHPPVSGVVIEVGPGSGTWVDLFKKGDVAPDGSGGIEGGSQAGGHISSVYGIEPNATVHPLLWQRIRRSGLEGIYEIVPVGIESLDESSEWAGKIEKESVDYIVSILCLCSIPEPEKNIKELYSYLKKGGRWYVYEHVRVNARYPGIRAYQGMFEGRGHHIGWGRGAFINLFWPYIIGGCKLDRCTDQWLLRAGSWDDVDLGQPDEPWYGMLPHSYGILTK